MVRAVALVVNPLAGRGRAAALAEVVERRLIYHGLVVHRMPAPVAASTGDLGDVPPGVDTVAAVGGDGTVHRLLPLLAGTTLALGVVPAGSGNDLAAALGVPMDPLAATDLVATGSTRLIDLAVAGAADVSSAGTRWWATVLCAGFDSAVAARAQRMRWPAGPRRYDVALLAELAALRPVPFTVTPDHEPARRLPATLVAVGNTARYGGGLRICPAADPADGLLDVTVVGPVTRRELLRVAPRLRTGEHLDHPAVSRFRVGSLRLDAPMVTAYADGEPVGPLPLHIACRPGTLRVIAP